MMLWVATMFAINIGKRFGISQKTSTLVIAVLIGIWYTIFDQFFGAWTREQIITFIVGSLGTAKLIYDLAALHIEKK